MSTGQVCREKYYSYGSYLRSRGYDKEICNLVAAIENGEIQLGAITSYGTCGILINGNTTIQPCSTEGTYSAGTLRVTGGSDDAPSNFSITANHGMNLLGPVFQNYGTDVSYVVGSNTYHGNYFSMPEHVFTSNDSSTNVYIRGNLFVTNDGSMDSLYVNDLSAVNAQIDTLLPSAQDAYGINYQSISAPLRSRHVFGEDIMMGSVSPQSYTFTTTAASFFLRVAPADLRVNTFNDASMLIIDTSFAGQYLALDVSNNKPQYYNSVIEFNAGIDISSTNLDKVNQTVFFLHPGPILGLPNNYYPSPSKGDIIIDTRSLRSAAGNQRATIVYGTRRLHISGTIPDLTSDMSGSIYVPHLAVALQNTGPKITLNGGNISMNQRVYK